MHHVRAGGIMAALPAWLSPPTPKGKTMKQTYIYRITDKTDASKVFYVYARNLPSAKEWLWSNKPEIKGRFECVGQKKQPIAERAQEFSADEYAAIRHRIADMTNPDLWKNFVTKE
jgi:hypothetical protein